MMTVYTTHPIDTIVSSPEVRRGSPVIAGTGIRVMDIVAYHLFGDQLPPHELANVFKLSLGEVYAALAYYYLHQSEIDAAIAHDDEQGKRLASELSA